MIDFKPILSSRTILTNIVIGVIGVVTALGLLPEACSADAVAANLDVTVPTVVGTGLTLLAFVSSYFRVKASAILA